MDRKKAKAIANHSHDFKDGEIIEFVGMNDEEYEVLEVFIFTDSEGIRQELVEGEFEWIEAESYVN